MPKIELDKTVTSEAILKNVIADLKSIPKVEGQSVELRIVLQSISHDQGVSVRVRVNSSVRRAGRDRIRVSNQDVVETGYAPSS